jgi:Leucine-rich repeat (LRR) protein
MPNRDAPNLNTASSWTRDGINDAYNKGFIPTDIQNHYQNVITRQGFCRMAVRWLEYATGKTIDTVLSERNLSRHPNPFRDTNDPYILAAFALGITAGTSSNTFTPNGQFTREQAATMIMNTCRAIGVNVSNPPASGFADMNTVSSWAVNGVNFARANGIMQGTGNNNFSPKGTYTREQSIVTFSNIRHEALPGQSPTPTPTPTPTPSAPEYITIKGGQFSTALTSLILNDRGIRDEDIVQLRYMTNLTTLELNRNQISDLTPISGLSRLTWLKLEGNQISDLTPLTDLSRLRNLSLGNNLFNDITPLSNLTSLRDLSLTNNSIINLSPLSGLTSLTELYVSNTQVSNLSPLSGLTNLTRLWMWNNSISDISPLSDLTQLSWVYLNGNNISDIRPLSGLSNMRTLILSDNQISDLTPLSSLSNLDSLTMLNNRISNVSPLSSLTDLTELRLQNNQISDISPLSNLRNLRLAYLNGNPITDWSPVSHVSDVRGR